MVHPQPSRQQQDAAGAAGFPHDTIKLCYGVRGSFAFHRDGFRPQERIAAAHGSESLRLVKMAGRSGTRLAPPACEDCLSYRKTADRLAKGGLRRSIHAILNRPQQRWPTRTPAWAPIKTPTSPFMTNGDREQQDVNRLAEWQKNNGQLRNVKVIEKWLTVKPGNCANPAELIAAIGRAVSQDANNDSQPIRFVVTSQSQDGLDCELGVLSKPLDTDTKPLFHFRPRLERDDREFNVIFLVPTGIGAEIGGHSGDSGPVARLLGSACSTLITHPNVGNAADINELPTNALYVEGSVITDLLMGNVELQPVRSNRLLLLMERHADPWFMDATVNMASAARAAAGFHVGEIVVLNKNFSMRSLYTPSGRAAGEVDGLECVFDCLDRRRGSFDAVAIASLIKVPSHYHKDYFEDCEDRIVNPWGGVEAMLTHALSRCYRVPTAHAPMMTSREVQTLDYGPVDPRKAAEPVSSTYLFSVLKGLHRSPAIRAATGNPGAAGRIGVENVHCLIIPEGCLGLPTLAALAQRVPIISVRGNSNCMRNSLRDLPNGAEGITSVDNYLEAVGVMSALRSGITLESVRRPIPHTKVTFEADG